MNTLINTVAAGYFSQLRRCMYVYANKRMCIRKAAYAYGRV